MRFGIFSRPVVGETVNGDSYVVEEWNRQTLLGVIDGLGHGEQAALASSEARKYILANHTWEIEELISGMHEHLRGTRGVVAGLLRIDRDIAKLSFCGIGNVNVSIQGQPQMHPTCLDGIIGSRIRKIMKFGYNFDSIRSVVLHSDGISDRFSLSSYPYVFERPQAAAEQIMADWGKKEDDATVLIAIEEEQRPGFRIEEFDIPSEVRALTAAEQAKELAEELGFSEVDQSKIAIATSELAQNIVVHAQGNGRLVIKSVTEGGKVGLTVIAEDSGPGIDDIGKALEGGCSTKSGLGIGLAGAKRLMDDLRIDSEPGKGTTVTATKWKG